LGFTQGAVWAISRSMATVGCSQALALMILNGIDMGFKHRTYDNIWD
jgi:hypothetical protein